MKKQVIMPKTQIKVVLDMKGESIEQMLRRMRTSGEPIEAKAKIQYFDRKDGVLPFNDIRTDRFEYARMATDKLHASSYAERMNADGFKLDDKGHWVKMQEATGGEA